MSPRNGCMEATGLKFGVYKIDGFFSSGKFLAGVRFLIRFCVWGRAEQSISAYLHW